MDVSCSVLAIITIPLCLSHLFLRPQENLKRCCYDNMSRRLSIAQHAVLDSCRIYACAAHSHFAATKPLFSLDAIARTLWRLLISHRRLLEWNPSGDTTINDDGKIIKAMWIAPAIAGVIIDVICAHGLTSSAGVAAGGADSVSVVRVARDRVVDEPHAAGARCKTVGRSDIFPT